MFTFDEFYLLEKCAPQQSDPYYLGASMTTTTITTKSHRRFVALGELASGAGINPNVELSSEMQELFGLESGNVDAFINKLRILEEHAEEKAAMEAAFYALGVDTIGQTLRERRDTLLDKRYGMRWDVYDSSTVERQELRGLAIMSSGMYDLLTDLLAETSRRIDLATSVAAIADSQSTPRNVSRMLNQALDNTGSRA